LHFINGYLLAGAVLAGMPVLLHLLMKQKPVVQVFPALRFLRKRMETSRRRMQIQNWLLLALRILLVLLLCLALAWPQIRGLGFGWVASTDVAAVFVVDTSASMDLKAGEKKRIELVKEIIESIRAEFGEDSKLALFDTSEGAEAAWIARPLFEQKLGTLLAKPQGGPLGPSVAKALELLRKDQSLGGKGKAVYILTDRAPWSWDSFSSSVPVDSIPQEVKLHLVDVGLDKAIDHAIERVELEPAVVPPGGKVTIRVVVRSSGEPFRGQLTCALENDPDPARKPDVKSLEIPANESRTIVFEKTVPIRGAGNGAELLGQVQLKLLPEDNWPANNKGQATFLIREKRQVLTLVDQPGDARIWKAALEAMGTYSCEVRVGSNPKEWTPEALAPYQVVCLLEMASPPDALWTALSNACKAGKGVAIIPPGEGLVRASWESQAAKELLPTLYTTLVTMPANAPGARWADFSGDSPLTSAFRTWARSVDPDFSRGDKYPFANRFWKTAPSDQAKDILASFSLGNGATSPALLEKTLGRGRVIQFTTPLSGKRFEGNRQWHNYLDSSFGLILADRVCAYLGGDASAAVSSFYAGQLPYFTMPNPPPRLPLEIKGPGLTQAESSLSVPDGVVQVPCAQAREPGNFQIFDRGGNPVAGFSVSLRPVEMQLNKVEAEILQRDIPSLVITNGLKPFETDDLLPPSDGGTLDLLPWLMMFVVIMLLVEGVVANRYHRKVQEPDQGPPSPAVFAAPQVSNTPS